MKTIDERTIVSLIRQFEAQFYSEKTIHESEMTDLIKLIDARITSDINKSYSEMSLQTLLKIPEIALKFQSTQHIAESHLKYFMTNIKSNGLYYIKAQMLWGKMLAQKANDENLKSVDKMMMIRNAILHLKIAQETISRPENQGKYGFMTFNVSRTIYQIVKNYFRPGYIGEFASIIEFVSKDLISDNGKEYDWKGFFTWLLIYCIKDLPSKNPSENFYQKELEKLWELSKKNPYSFHEALFRLKMSMIDKNKFGDFKKEVEKDKKWFSIYILQGIKSGKFEENQIENQINICLKNLMPNNYEEKQLDPKNYLFELLAETARIAAFYGIKKVADKIIDLLKKIKSLSPRAILLSEFTKAELLLHSKSEITNDGKNGINLLPSKDYEIDKRKEALQILQKALNKKLNYDPLLIYEGCVLIWNISLPFLNESFKNEVSKSFMLAAKLLEQVESNDFDLRIRFHYEIVSLNLENKQNKGLEIDSQTMKILKEHISKCRHFLHFSEHSFNQEKIYNLFEKIQNLESSSRDSDESFLYSCESKLINFANRKIDDWQNILPDMFTEIRSIYFKILNKEFLTTGAIPENLKDKNSSKYLNHFEKLDQNKADYFDSKQKEMQFFNKKYQNLCRIFLILSKACKISFDNEAYEFANEFAGLFDEFYKNIVNKFDFDSKELSHSNKPDNNEKENILALKIKGNQEFSINYVKILYIKSQALVKILAENGVDFALKEVDVSTPKSQENEKMKEEINQNFIKGVKLSLSLNQTWLVFNGGILIWNTYLPVFKNNQNDSKLHPRINFLLEVFFESLKEAFSKVEKRKIVNYDMETIIQVYCNISIIYIRLLEQKYNNDELNSLNNSNPKDSLTKIKDVIDSLLLVSLTPQTRKMINSILSRVKNLHGTDSNNKANKKETLNINNQSDQLIFDINSKLETIQNNATNTKSETLKIQNIQECFKLLLALHDMGKDDLDKELECELWTKLANLALNEEKLETVKLAISCLEFAKNLSGDPIPTSLLKFSSLSMLLYGKALCWLVDNKKIENESHEILLFQALKKVLDSIEYGAKVKNNKVVEAIKKFYIIVSKIEIEYFSFENRQSLIKPIFTLIFHLKGSKELTEVIYKDIEISQIIVNLMQTFLKGCLFSEDWELANIASTLLFEMLNPSLKEHLWTIKIVAQTKQKVNFEMLQNEIKETNSKLQSELYQQIAWNTDNVEIQYQAFIKAIELTKRENSLSVCQILLNFSEWLFHNNFPLSNIHSNLDHVEELVMKKALDQANLIEHSHLINVPEPFSHLKIGKVRQESIINCTQQSIFKAQIENRRPSLDGFDKKSESININAIFTVEECDTMFQVYVIKTLLGQSFSEKQSNLEKAIIFVDKTFRIIFETMKKSLILNQTQEKENSLNDSNKCLNSSFTIPETFEDWMQLQFNADYLNQIDRTKSVHLFCKAAYKQPLVTFNNLMMILEMAEEFSSQTKIALLINFFYLFASKIIELPISISLLHIFKARHYFNCNNTLAFKSEIKDFTKSMISEEDFFEIEFTKFKIIHHEAFSKNFQYPSFTSKTKAPHFLNHFNNFEFWIIIAEILLSVKEFELSHLFAARSIDFCFKASAFELLGKAHCLIARVNSIKGENALSTKLFSEAGKNIKLLQNWQKFVLHSSDHFISLNQFDNAKLIVNKFDAVINQSMPKEAFQGNVFIGNQISALTKLIRAKIILEEFQSVSKFYSIEMRKIYVDNFKKGCLEVLVILNQFNQMLELFFSISNLNYFYETVKKIYIIFTKIIIATPEVFDYLYIYSNIVILILFDTINAINRKSKSTKPIKFVKKHEEEFVIEKETKISNKNNGLKKNLKEKNENKLIVSEFQGQTLKEKIIYDKDFELSDLNCLFLKYLVHQKILCTQFINFVLSIENTFEKWKLKFPRTLESHCQEKIFGESLKEQQFVQNNLPESYKISSFSEIQEFIYLQNFKRTCAYLEYNRKTFIFCQRYFRSSIFNFENEFFETLLLGYKQTKFYSIKAPCQIIFGNFEEFDSEKNSMIESGCKNIENKTEFLNSIENFKSWPSFSIEPFLKFFNTEYFIYNQNKLGFLINENLHLTNEEKFKLLVDYQSIKCQKYLYNYFMNSSLPNNEVKISLQNLLQNKNQSDFLNFLKQHSFLNNFFILNIFTAKIDKLLKDSFYIIIEPDDLSFNLHCAIMYIDDKIFETNYFLMANQRNMQAKIKKYLRYLEKAMHPDKFNEEKTDYLAKEEKNSNFDNAPNLDNNFTTNIKFSKNGEPNEVFDKISQNNKTLIDFEKLDQKFLEEDYQDFIVPVKTFIKFIEEKKLEQNKIDSKNQTKFDLSTESCSFNGLILLVNYELIQFPFERLFSRALEKKFKMISKDISFHTIIQKIEKELSNKQDIYSLSETFFILNDERDTSNFEEISQVNSKIKANISDGFVYGSKYFPHQSEILIKITRSKVCLYKGCVDFLEFINKELLISAASISKLDILFCFDKVKVADEKFIKIQKTIKNGSNFIQYNDLIAISAILNIRCLFLPSQFIHTQKILSTIDQFNQSIEQQKNLCLLTTQNIDARFFSSIGYPLLAIAKDKKKKE